MATTECPECARLRKAIQAILLTEEMGLCTLTPGVKHDLNAALAGEA